MSLQVRPADAETDWPAVWAILEPVIRAGETYAVDRDLSETAARAYWFGSAHEVFVAGDEGQVLGTYYLRANFAGGAAHVANCGYMTARDAQGRGVARAMCEHSLAHARSRGFRAMQFNCVVSTNIRAVALWEGLGFAIAGRLPGAYAHPTKGEVDALVMYRRL